MRITVAWNIFQIKDGKLVIYSHVAYMHILFNTQCYFLIVNTLKILKNSHKYPCFQIFLKKKIRSVILVIYSPLAICQLAVVSG